MFIPIHFDKMSCYKLLDLEDEAQKLSPESLKILRSLLNYETDKHKISQIILVGQIEKASFFKGKGYYLFAALFAAIAFFNGYYFSKADFNREKDVKNISDMPVRIINPANTNKENENVSPSDLIENLRLVGIARDDELNAMIEDKKSGKTFFLKKGESFYKLKIEKILVDRVILECEGKEFELM